MSWSDIFYPGNPERREQLIRKNQELQDLMKSNFKTTNKLIKVLKDHLGLSFSPITLNEKAVKDNCDVLIERIHEIQAEVEKIDKKLKQMLEPALYEKLKRKNLSIPEHRKVSAVLNVAFGVASLASSVVVGWLIKSRMILTSITSTCGIIGASILAGFAVGVLFMGVNMIIQAILGSYERGELEKALKEYDEALEEFRPASEEYQHSLTCVIVRIEMMEEGEN